MNKVDSLLDIENVSKTFGRGSFIDKMLGRDNKAIKAVDDVNLTIKSGNSIGLIGESGCGKTTLLRTIAGLYDISEGTIRFNGQSLSEFTKEDWKRFRRKVQLIFQDPFNSLDPKLSVLDSLKEPLRIHDMGQKVERINEMLGKVKLHPSEDYLHKYPRQLSGGEKQRVSIARALVTEPDVILADEPVSMLDVSTQSEILNLLSELVSEQEITLVYISHDLSTVSYVCDKINIMYLGRIIEKGHTMDVLNTPNHPYTKALVNAVPIPDPRHDRERTTLEESPRDPSNIDQGCRFRDRCPDRMDVCEIAPKMIEPTDEENREVACHLYYEDKKAEELVSKEINGDLI